MFSADRLRFCRVSAAPLAMLMLGLLISVVPAEVIEPERPPLLTSPQVVPYNRNDLARYVFSVRYTSPDRSLPRMIQVVVDGNPITLTTKSRNGYDAVYSSAPVKLGVGHHKYYFHCEDGRGLQCRSPRYGEWDGPYVAHSWRKSYNTYPELTDGHLVQGAIGDVGTYFTFSVKFSDYDSTPPRSVKVVIDGKPHEMKLHKGLPENGTYIYNTYFDTLPHAYYFIAEDAGGAKVTYPTEGFLRGPAVYEIPNSNPELTDARVNPIIGQITDCYTFSVRYVDPDQDPPAIIQVYVNDAPHNMKLRYGKRCDGVYECRLRLAPSNFHRYYFRAEDGRGGVTALPLQGYLHGPVVTNQK